MKTIKTGTLPVLVLVLVIAMSVGASAATNAITVAQLAGPWQVAVSGNTGCGVTSILYNGKLDNTGKSTGTMTFSSAGCGVSTSTQTFNILSMSGSGSGTVGLTCGSGCGFIFTFQASKNKQVINLVDVSDGGTNVLAGTAVKQTAAP